MGYVGDFLAASSVALGFNTVSTAGVPTTLAGTPTVAVYKNSSTTESTSGVTLTVDFDSRTGSHIVVIDTSSDGTFYAAGSDFRVELTAGTVGGTSVVGAIVGTFSIQNRTQLANVTRWNTVTVATPATAGIPEINVKNINNVSASSVTTVAANQGTTQPLNFTGTGASALVKGDAIDWNSVAVTGMPMPTYTQPTGFLAATFPSGTIANTTNITAGTIATVTNLTNAATSGDFTAAMKASITAAVPTAAQNATANWANATRTLTTLAGLTVDANMIKILDDPSAASGLQAMGNMFDTSGAVPATDSSGNALATATALTAAANAILTEGGPGPWTTGGGGGTPLTAQETRDAMYLSPSPGIPDIDSVDAKLDTIIAAGGGSGLTGPIAFTVHTEDSLGVLVPFVDFTVLGQGPGRTDDAGDFSGGLPATGDYTFVGRPTDGLLFASVTQAITSGSMVTLVGTAPAVTPPTDPLLAVGYVIMRDRNGAIKPGAELTYTITIGPGTDGDSYDTSPGTAVADINGLLTITAPCSSTLNVIRGDGLDVVVPFPDTSSTFALPEVLGRDVTT